MNLGCALSVMGSGEAGCFSVISVQPRMIPPQRRLNVITQKGKALSYSDLEFILYKPTTFTLTHLKNFPSFEISLHPLRSSTCDSFSLKATKCGPVDQSQFPIL
jgi:hypothetical protein